MADDVGEKEGVPQSPGALSQAESLPSPVSETASLPSEPSSATASPSVQTKTKIDVLLKATGDAPIMKKKKWAVDRTKKIKWITEFIRRYINIDPSESLFLYVNQSFAPSPDTDVAVLYECFGAEGKLVLHYCKTQAWG